MCSDEDVNLIKSKTTDQILKEIKSIYHFDLNTGPYITGSFVTYMIASQYESVNWTFNDIDIICGSQSQYENIHDILKKVSHNYMNNPQNALNEFINHYMDGYRIQIVNRPDIAVNYWLENVDYTICAGCTDGKRLIVPLNTLSDIKNKVLRENNDSITEKRVLKWGVDYVKKRYQKYIDRGYVDFNQTIFNKLKLYENS